MIVGNFLTLLEITLFFATDMHHLVIAALNDSYTLFEPGELPTTGDAAALITKTVAGAFRIGIQLSAPFIVFGLLFNIGLGILARLMPQIQVFFVGLPLSILIGLLFLLLLLGAMMSFFLEYAGGVLQLREQASEAGHRRNPRQLRLDEFGREHDAVLHDVAGESGDAQDQKRHAKSGGDIEGERHFISAAGRAVGSGSSVATRMSAKVSRMRAEIFCSPKPGSSISMVQALANFAKGLAKLCVVGGVMAVLLWPQRQMLGSIVTADPAMLLSFIRSIALKLLGTVVAVLAVIATADYLFQYRQWYERQKMSLQEIKEEFRQTEGDPTIKGKLRQLRAKRMRKRIIAAVPKVSVVITNPTHYAIALKYERGMNAPVCVSEGVDLIARKIREVAEEHRIPVVENPPLARALHATVEIDRVKFRRNTIAR